MTRCCCRHISKLARHMKLNSSLSCCHRLCHTTAQRLMAAELTVAKEARGRHQHQVAWHLDPPLQKSQRRAPAPTCMAPRPTIAEEARGGHGHKVCQPARVPVGLPIEVPPAPIAGEHQSPKGGGPWLPRHGGLQLPPLVGQALIIQILSCPLGITHLQAGEVEMIESQGQTCIVGAICKRPGKRLGRPAPSQQAGPHCAQSRLRFWVLASTLSVWQPAISQAAGRDHEHRDLLWWVLLLPRAMCTSKGILADICGGHEELDVQRPSICAARRVWVTPEILSDLLHSQGKHSMTSNCSCWPSACYTEADDTWEQGMKSLT